jgi:hypothetical protein
MMKYFQGSEKKRELLNDNNIVVSDIWGD